jgi:hypothetical protein
MKNARPKNLVRTLWFLLRVRFKVDVTLYICCKNRLSALVCVGYHILIPFIPPNKSASLFSFPFCTGDDIRSLNSGCFGRFLYARISGLVFSLDSILFDFNPMCRPFSLFPSFYSSHSCYKQVKHFFLLLNFCLFFPEHE